MTKRGRNSLTGGTGDVNPQFMSGSITQAATNIQLTNAYVSPIAKGIFSSKGRATVMEVLKIFVQFSPYQDLGAGHATYARRIGFGTKEKDAGAVINCSVPDLFLFWEDNLMGAFTALGSVTEQIKNCYVLDLSDGQGHGILVAGDYIYVTFGTTAFPAVSNAFWKIMYRFKNVALTEYIGIVQSQQ